MLFERDHYGCAAPALAMSLYSGLYVWSLFKRSLIGSYHQLSTKHLDAYLDELEWRYNNRDNPYLFRDTLAALLSAESLEYSQLIGK